MTFDYKFPNPVPISEIYINIRYIYLIEKKKNPCKFELINQHIMHLNNQLSSKPSRYLLTRINRMWL